ncbi:MAG: DNA repair protein RecN [Pseudomonadota bacterium]|nr:DNA repair protein RecN [Pseudomonadota bacterium]
MLKFLSIRDFVIVDSLELDFSSGFTALTGETGAGKSILIDALSLALGERGDAGMVRSGCERADISTEFDIAALPDLQSWLCEQELVDDANVCLLRRVLDANGRSRGFINGRSVTLQQMRDVGEYLLDIHGQHAHQSLLRPDAQRDLLDGYAGLISEVGELAGLFREWQTLLRRHTKLEQTAEAAASERELLLFQRHELEMLNFTVQAWMELQADYARLSHAADLLETAQFGVEILSEADTACLAQLNALTVRLRVGIEFDGSLQDTLNMVESAHNDLQEAVYALRHYPQKVDVDPQKLREQEQRMAAVVDASRKYRVMPEQLPGILQCIVERLDDLGSDADLAALAQQEAVAREQYQSAAKKLGAARKKAAEKLSRISLAIQVAASQAATVPTLIFDEVDSGIGGRVAEIVGALLKRLGQRHQVMCVTHLPQVAAMADAQWQVSKSSRNSATVSTISILNQAERVEEIARMLGGVRITDTTRKHAAEMLEAGLGLPS